MDREKVLDLLKQFGVLGLVGIVGLAIVGYGLWLAVVPEEPKVEIVAGDKSSDRSSVSLPAGGQGSEVSGQIVVDVAGAVETPGVYKLSRGSRIGDALVAAGGLAAGADRAWVSRTINLAQEVKDGGKVFIPSKADENNKPIYQQTNEPMESQGSSININTASASELDSLWGIGAARAQAIIANRPYASVEELVSKAKIPENVYEKIKEQISVY